MSFGGVQAMISSIKSNLALKGNRKTYFDRDAEKWEGSYKKFEDHVKMTPYEFEQFKKELREKKRRDKKRTYIVYGVTAVLGILILYGLSEIFLLMTQPDVQHHSHLDL